MNKWQLLRQHQSLADDGLVSPILHHCGEPLVSVLGGDEDPAFYCGFCNATMMPGIIFWDNIIREIDNNDLAGP